MSRLDPTPSTSAAIHARCSGNEREDERNAPAEQAEPLEGCLHLLRRLALEHTHVQEHCNSGGPQHGC